MKRSKVIVLSLSLVILSALTFVGVAGAQGFKTGDTVTVAATETIDSMLFAAGKNINILGKVNGDVYCAGETITISGTVTGDVFCAGQTITINGTVEGGVRLAAQTVTLGGTITNSATVGAQNLTIDNTSIINRDLLGGSQNITVNGHIKRDLLSGSENITINGIVGRNVNGGLQSLTIGSTANVGGNVEYISDQDLNIITGGKISGSVNRTTPDKNQQIANYAPGFVIGWFMYVIIAMIILSITLVSLFPRIFKEAAAITAKKPGKIVLVGFLSMIITPVVMIMLMTTVIGIPVAIIILLISIIIMIISAPFTGYMIGRTVLKDQKEPIWIILAGTTILAITYFIPFVGFIAIMASHIFGTGMILIQSKKLLARTTVKK